MRSPFFPSSLLPFLPRGREDEEPWDPGNKVDEEQACMISRNAKVKLFNQSYLIFFRPSLEITTVVVWKRTFLLKES